MSESNKRYFYLNRECLLVPGKKNSAIYNLSSGDIYSIEQKKAEILYFTEKCLSVDEISDRLQNIDESKVKTTLDEALSKGLGKYYKKKTFIEKYKIGRPIQRKFFKQPPIIENCYIELPGKCNNDCSFCKSLKFADCNMCTHPSTRPVKLEDIMAFLRRVTKLQIKSIIFHGGDPLIEDETLFTLIDFCRRQGYCNDVWIISNGNNITREVVNKLKKYNVGLIIPFDDSEIIKRQELNEISHELNRQGISFNTSLVINESNKVKHVEMQNFVKGLGASKSFKVVVLREQKNNLVSILKKTRKQLPRISAEMFYHNTEHHPCLDKTIAVDVHGNLLPCPSLTSEALGNISDSELINAVFETRIIHKYWGLSLDQCNGCKDCGFRFACIDCRAAAEKLSGNLYGKTLCYQ